MKHFLMNTTKFKATVSKGNNKGAGFIRIPLKFRTRFSIGDQYKVKIDSKIKYFAKIRNYSGKGVFVPIEITKINKLYRKKVAILLEKVDGFFVNIGSDGRVYIPNFYNIKNEDIILINSKIDRVMLKNYFKIYQSKRRGTRETIIYFDKSYYAKKAICKIVKLFPNNKLKYSQPFFKFLLGDFDFAEIEKDKIIVYHGNRIPIIINKNITIKNLAYYLGCYFADGTKKGTHWGICASTFKQAKYYKEMHESIIHDAKIVYSLSYSDPENKNKDTLKNNLRGLWQKNTSIALKNISVMIHLTQYEDAPNRNPYGTLILKENRELTRIYYVRLLQFLFNEIKKNKNRKIALDFILGVLEGDGCPGPEKRGHIVIATNSEDSLVLEEILGVCKIKFHVRKEGGNRYIIHIGSLEIIRNISILKDKLFKYYPKRRKILKERLAKTGCARFLLGQSLTTSNWLIGQLNNYKILDGKGNLTKFGKKVKEDLNKFLKRG